MKKIEVYKYAISSKDYLGIENTCNDYQNKKLFQKKKQLFLARLILLNVIKISTFNNSVLCRNNLSTRFQTKLRICRTCEILRSNIMQLPLLVFLSTNQKSMKQKKHRNHYIQKWLVFKLSCRFKYYLGISQFVIWKLTWNICQNIWK